MNGILRIEGEKAAAARTARARSAGLGNDQGETGETKPDDYIKKLLKMIPGEIVAAYTAGAGVVPKDRWAWLCGWSVTCGIILLVIRCQATKDPATNKCQTGAVLCSLLAYLIWLWVIGGPFERFAWHETWQGTLAAIAWTVIVPLVYKPKE